MSFTLNSRKAADTAVLDVLDPATDLPSGWKITFAGPGHPVTIEHSQVLSRRSLQNSRAMEAAQVNGKKWKPDEKDVDQVKRENAEFFTARMLDWSPIKFDEDGQEIPFSRERAIELLLDPGFGWLYKQVVDFLKDDGAFTRGSATA